MPVLKLALVIFVSSFFISIPNSNAQEETKVGLELVLLADATGSIDDAEILFQRQGYAKAITDPAVIDAISISAYEKIAVTYVEWGDADSQHIVVDWQIIDGAKSAHKFAEDLLKPERLAFGYNAIGSALMFGKNLIEKNNIWGLRRVIDISADSANNWSGPTIPFARSEVIEANITINGLAVLCRHCSGRPNNYNLEEAFKSQIIGGNGAFVITADSANTFAAAVRRKLILEIADTSPTGAVRTE